MFCAIIGDIVQSRKFNERSKIQDKLRAALDSINEEYDELIASKFIITLGDEFQGLLKTTDKLIDIIYRIVMEMHPVKIRIGIGIGDILTEINKEMSLGADGPAYHNARKMLDEMKKQQGQNG